MDERGFRPETSVVQLQQKQNFYIFLLHTGKDASMNSAVRIQDDTGDVKRSTAWCDVTHPSLQALCGTPESGRSVWSGSAGTSPGRTSISRGRRGIGTWNEPENEQQMCTEILLLSYCRCLFAQREAQSSDLADSYLGPVLDLVDGELHRNVETVQDVAPKHQRVLRSVDGVDPAWNPNQFRSKDKGIGVRIHANAASQWITVSLSATLKGTLPTHQMGWRRCIPA